MGGAPHFGGGGGMRVGGGGGGMHFGGAPRVGGGPAIGAMRAGGGPRFGGVRVGGAPRFAGRPAISHVAARPSFRSQRSFAARSGPSRTASRAAALRTNAPITRSAAITRSNAALSRNSRNANASIGPNGTATMNRAAIAKSNAVRNTLNSRPVAGALHNPTALRNPNARAQLLASAATAGWHDGRGGHGWWRHRHGGFGWVGPLFWPLAYYDIYDYTLWGYGYDPLFWDYGYNDIYAGVFAPYGYDDLVGYLPAGSGGPGYGAGSQAQATVGRASYAAAAPNASSEQLAQLCGDDSRAIAGLPIDQIQQVIQPNDAQRAALDDLANASVKAAQDIKAACPTQISLTAPGRLAAMQQRIEAIISAVDTVQPALQKFFDLLNDEQRARLTALAQGQRRAETARNSNGSLVQSCGAAQAGVAEWPAAEIEARVHPTEAQRASLTELQQASAKAVETLKASCPTAEPITPPARLEAIANRLGTMLQAVKTVRAALDDFYDKLSDEQKAQFEAIGPARIGSSDQPAASGQEPTPRTHVRRYHHAGIPGIVRHFMSMARW
jgi:LTXXQ motif family protein